MTSFTIHVRIDYAILGQCLVLVGRMENGYGWQKFFPKKMQIAG